MDLLGKDRVRTFLHRRNKGRPRLSSTWSTKGVSMILLRSSSSTEGRGIREAQGNPAVVVVKLKKSCYIVNDDDDDDDCGSIHHHHAAAAAAVVVVDSDEVSVHGRKRLYC